MHKVSHHKSIILLLSAAFMILSVSGCQNKAENHTRAFFSMDTYMTLQCYGDSSAEQVLTEAESEVYRLASIFDAEIPSSDISLLNASGQAVVSDDTSAVISRSITISQSVNGSFNILVRPLVELWGFNTNSPSHPEDSAISDLLPIPEAVSIRIDGNEITLPECSRIDLGAIAKGYCSDRIRSILSENGIHSALVSLGGNVMALGSKPDGSAWKIAIRNPFDESGILGIVSICDRSVITSGSYQRYFEENGINYHHILDPETGCPADNGLVSVTVISTNGTNADALSTAFFVLGLDDSLSMIDTLPDNIRPDGIIFVSEDGTITVKGDIDFSPDNGTKCIYLP